MDDARVRTITKASAADIQFLEEGSSVQTVLLFILPEQKADSLSHEEETFLEKLAHNKSVSEMRLGAFFGMRSGITGGFFNGLLRAVSANLGLCIKSLSLTNFQLRLRYDNASTFIKLLSAAFRCDALHSFALENVLVFLDCTNVSSAASIVCYLHNFPAVLNFSEGRRLYLADDTIIGRKSVLEHALFHSNSLKEIKVPSSLKIFKFLQLRQNTMLILQSVFIGGNSVDINFYYELSRILPKIHTVTEIWYTFSLVHRDSSFNMYLFFLKSLLTLNSPVKLMLSVGSGYGGHYSNEHLQVEQSAIKILGDFIERAEMLESCDIFEYEPTQESFRVIFERVKKIKKSRWP